MNVYTWFFKHIKHVIAFNNQLKALEIHWDDVSN